jgi:hypothetical protein
MESHQRAVDSSQPKKYHPIGSLIKHAKKNSLKSKSIDHNKAHPNTSKLGIVIQGADHNDNQISNNKQTEL